MHAGHLIGDNHPAVSIEGAIRLLWQNIDQITAAVRDLMKLTPNDRNEWFRLAGWSFPIPSRDSEVGMLAGTREGVPNGDVDDSKWTEADQYFAAIYVLRDDIQQAQPIISDMVESGIDRWLRIPFERSPGAWTSELLSELGTLFRIYRRVFGSNRRTVRAGQFGCFQDAEKAELLKCLDALETKREKLFHLDMATLRTDVDAAVCESFPGSRPAQREAAPAAEGEAPSARIPPGTDDGDFFRDIASWAADELKGKQRRCIEMLAGGSGAIPIADLACDSAIDWADPFDEPFKSMVKALNPKLRKKGCRIHRHDNEARLEKMGQK